MMISTKSQWRIIIICLYYPKEPLKRVLTYSNTSLTLNLKTFHYMSYTTLRATRNSFLKQSKPISRSITYSAMSMGQPSDTAKVQDNASPSGSFSSYNIKNSSINSASGVSLSEQQKLLVGSVLDVFNIQSLMRQETQANRSLALRRQSNAQASRSLAPWRHILGPNHRRGGIR